jgi:hypothetical protein
MREKLKQTEVETNRLMSEKENLCALASEKDNRMQHQSDQIEFFRSKLR